MADRPGLRDRLLRGTLGVPLAAGHLPLPKVAWLNPLQLLRTGYHVWLVTAAAGIIDRREMLAALDRRSAAPPSHDDSVLIAGEKTDAVLADPSRYDNDGLWVDFVADVGDSWEATYAVASLLVDTDLRSTFPASARRDLPEKFGPAEVVVIGGDLVYPMGSREGYRRRMQAPFSAALSKAGDRPSPGLFAIPGNHDWYDGLTNFFREFCQGGFLGGWQLFQRRSYFAVKLTKGWWLWGIDIALDTRIDSPQQAYFLKILQDSAPDQHPPPATGGAAIDQPVAGAPWAPLERFEAQDRIILCTAKPAWVEISRYSDEAYRNLEYFVEQVVNQHHGRVPVILTGDLHHYSRYANDDGYQMITSGGGGAYLMGTHFLPERIPRLEPLPALELDRDPAAKEKPKPRVPGSEFTASGFPYPSRRDSRRLALGSLLLACRPANWLFCLLVGEIYWFLARGLRPSRLAPQVRMPEPAVMNFLRLPQWLWSHPGTINAALVIGVTCFCALFAVVVNGRASRFLTAIWGTLHGIAHVWVAAALVWLIAENAGPAHRVLALMHLTRPAPYVLPNLFVLLAGLVGGTLVGIYLVISDRYFDLHHNDVFAVQSLIDYRNFLRLHIRADGGLDIFPIGLRRVPRRWRRRMDAKPTEPCFEPADTELAPHLIEGPIRIPPQPAQPQVAGARGAS